MGQDSVLKLLKKTRKELSPQQIADALEISRSSATQSLRKLIEQGKVEVVAKPIIITYTKQVYYYKSN